VVLFGYYKIMELKSMKSTGVVRNIDDLGRIVIPSELRKALGINLLDSLEIFTDDDSIIFRKYEIVCIFCKDDEEVTHYNNKCICKKCLEKIKTLDNFE
jgi:transcriptional pleiotropic regulator of transition state genes